MENIEAKLKDESYFPFLSKEVTLKERINETREILEKYKRATPKNIANKLRSIMLPERYQKGDFYEVPLYSKYKPKKELEYLWRKIEPPLYPHSCPWCPNLHATTEFIISREMTKKEEKADAQYMTLMMLRATYEDDAERGDKKAIKELNRIDLKIDKLNQISQKTISIDFTNLLPHFIEKHTFFPDTGPYEIDIIFLLEALDYKKIQKLQI